MSDPTWQLEDDAETVTVTLPTTPPTVLRLKAAGVEAILATLGEVRRHMSPEVPLNHSALVSVGVRDPHWAADVEELSGDSFLHLRDPRFGWLHFMLSKSSAKALAELLQKQVDAPPPSLGDRPH